MLTLRFRGRSLIQLRFRSKRSLWYRSCEKTTRSIVSIDTKKSHSKGQTYSIGEPNLLPR